LLLAICGWVAEQERLRIGDRTKAGLERAKKRGVRLGRPRVNVDTDKLLALRASGMSLRDIASVMAVSLGRVHQAVRTVQEGMV
jgi:DNA invertase Pin-like site-specific DNA recombinase